MMTCSFLDINECATNHGDDECENEATCSNNDGIFTCSYADGWEGDLCADGKTIT